MKKVILFGVCGITLFSINIEGMENQRHRIPPSSNIEEGNRQQLPRTFTYRLSREISKRWSQQIWEHESNTIDYVLDPISIWSIADYLVQLGSISSIDSTNAGTIGKLAKARTFFNITAMLAGIYRLSLNETLTGERDLSASKRDLIDIARTYLRGKHTLLDVKNWKNADSLAANNTGRKEDKSLRNKKWCQYAWLTFNKVLPAIAKYFDFEERHNYKFLARISEIFRQKLMYAMITNKQKLA